MGDERDEPHPRQAESPTWNDSVRIAVHRQLTPSARVQLMIEASRAALRFAHGRRVDER
jgi:DNA polymerase IIIc chi subunit